MELRRPKLEDKEMILEMLAAFEEVGSLQDGFFGGADFVFEEWLALCCGWSGCGLSQSALAAQ